jgi:hypothetical protein
MREYRSIPAKGKLRIPREQRQDIMFSIPTEIYWKLKAKAAAENKSLAKVCHELFDLALNNTPSTT